MSLLVLLNPSRAFLAISVVLSGYCIFRYSNNTTGNLLVLPYLAVAGMLLAMAGAGWRAIFAAALDNEVNEHNKPSSALSPTASFFVAVFTTLAGLMCAMTGGYNSFRAAGIAIVLMLARAALFRKVEIISPFLGGLSAGMIFALGMTAHSVSLDLLEIGEIRIPAAFFVLYMVVAAVLSQVRDTAKPRETPAGEELSSETASRLLEMRDDTVDRSVVWFGGIVLALIPLGMAWVMPWKWLSWTILGLLSLTMLLRLIPVLVSRTRKDLTNFVEAAYRGCTLLNAGAIASLGLYQSRDLFQGWSVPLPERNDQLIALAVIVLLAIPAWFLRRISPLE